MKDSCSSLCFFRGFLVASRLGPFSVIRVVVHPEFTGGRCADVGG